MADASQTPPPLPTPAPKITFKDGKIRIPDTHPDIKPAWGKVDAIREEREIAHSRRVELTNVAAPTEYEALQKKLREATNFKETTGAMNELDALFKKHAPVEHEEYTKLDTAHKAANEELTIAESKALKNTPHGEIEGLTEANKAEFEKAANKLHDYAKTAEENLKGGKSRWFDTLRAGKEAGGGLWAAIDQNLGKTAWKESKVKAAFNSGTALVSLGLLWDSIAHSKRKDEKGERTVDRSAGIRVGEATLALVGLGAQLRGGRSL